MLEEDLLEHRVLADAAGLRPVRDLLLHQRRHDVAGIDRIPGWRSSGQPRGLIHDSEHLSPAAHAYVGLAPGNEPEGQSSDAG